MRSLEKLAWVEGKLFTRDPLTVVFTLVFPALVVVILGAAFADEPPDATVWRGVEAIDFYVPAYIGLALSAMGLISVSVHVAAYREQGVLRRFRAAGIPAPTIMGAEVLVSALVTIPGIVGLIAIGVLGYDARLPAAPWGVLLAFALSAVAFASLGVLIGALMPGTRAAQGLGLILFFVMMFLAGAGPPREILPAWMRYVGDVLPLTHVVTTLFEPWVGFGVSIAELAGVAAMAALAASLGGLALRRI
ncbi:MAG TPA: ABC transporter permease [Streptosporangiaceae bacterium]|nr:ABC transporter permease [Streptosporangiaceae bacterium]